MSINRGGRHLYKSGSYTRDTKVVKVRRKGKSSYGDQIWELTLADGTSVRTSATGKHPFTRPQDFPGGVNMVLEINRARGTVTYVTVVGK